MKRIIGLVFLFIFIIFPIKIYAMSNETGYLDISTNTDFNVGSVYLKNFTITTYANYFNTGNTTNISGMFAGTSSLSSLDLTGFNTSCGVVDSL